MIKTLNCLKNSNGSLSDLFELKALTKCMQAIVICGASSGFVLAQDNSGTDSGAQSGTPEQLEEVLVYGIRASLRNAIDRKKQASTIQDSIVAEDIGEFPDKNVGEALQRVTGVQIGREFGEGNSVSIRGVEPQLVNVEVNGLTAIGTSDPFASQGRAVDFSSMASELVQALDVIKGSEARLTEGGIGGTIQVVTKKPNDFDENYLQVSLENQYNDLVEEHNQKLNIIGVNKFSEKVGGLLNLTLSNKDTAYHALRNTEWVRQGDYDGAPIKTNPNPDYANITDPADCPDSACASQFNDFRARIPRYSLWSRDEDRISANGMLEFEISDRLSAHIGYTHTSRDFVQTDSNMQLEVASDSQLVADAYVVGANSNVTSYTTRDALIVNRSVNNDWEIESSLIDLGFEFVGDQLTVTGSLGYSEQIQNIDQVETRVASNRVQDIVVNFDSSGAPVFNLNEGNNRADPTQFFDINSPDAYWFYSRIQPENFDQENDQLTAKLDFDYEMEGSFFHTARAGIRYSSEYQDHFRERYRLTRIVGNDYNGDTWTQEEQNALVQSSSFQLSNFMSGYDLSVPTVDGWLALDPARFEPAFNAAHADNITDEARTFAPLAFYEVEMDTTALYLQGDFETQLGNTPVWGNIGVRYVDTEVETTGDARIDTQVDVVPGDPAGGSVIANTVIGQRSIKHEYSETLPSINLNFGLIPDELILYLGAAKVMAHPKAKDLNIAANCTIRLDTLSLQTGNSNSCRAGNPRLQPYVANQWDVALSWYPDEDTLVSAAYFRKDLDTFVIDRADQFDQDFFGDGVLFDVNQVINGEGAKTKGFELAVTRSFTQLPGFFGNTGISANYSYLEGEDVGLFNRLTGEELPLPSQSETSYNITLFYETAPLSVKFAYNYRDEYLLRPSDRGGNPVFVDDTGILDAKIVYRPQGGALENFKFHFDARNLTSEGNVYVNGPGRVSEIRYSGREYALGVTYSL
jgi:TonB-dependent receptor